MATGGTGDVLTGLTAALLGQKLEPFDAARAGRPPARPGRRPGPRRPRRNLSHRRGPAGLSAAGVPGPRGRGAHRATIAIDTERLACDCYAQSDIPQAGPPIMNLLCPNCQKPLTVPEQYAGQPMRCPLCAGTFTVPALPQRRRRRRRCPRPAPKPTASRTPSRRRLRRPRRPTSTSAAHASRPQGCRPRRHRRLRRPARRPPTPTNSRPSRPRRRRKAISANTRSGSAPKCFSTSPRSRCSSSSC